MSSLFSALASQATNPPPNNQNSNNENNESNNRGRQPPAARRGGFSIANGALRSAGLMDGESGMREARGGPSRISGTALRRGGRGAANGGRGARNDSGNGEGSSRMAVDSDRPRGNGRRGNATSARDRSNPLAQGGRARRGGSNSSNQDNGIRGANERKGRVPGGGGVVGSSSASVLASAQSGSGTTSGGGKLIEGLKRFLASRWNEGAQFLNLENMGPDPILLELGFTPPGAQGYTKDAGSVIFKLCAEIYPNVATISLARNNLTSLSQVHTLPQYIPTLRNISLEANDLKWVKDLDSWLPTSGKSKSKKTAKFQNLSELVLTGNPVREIITLTGNEESYRADVLRKFPTLTLLDGTQVTTAESDFAKLPISERKAVEERNSKGPPKNFGVGMRSGFTDPSAETITPSFLQKYFSLYDSDRTALEVAYAPASTFTFSITMPAAPRAKSAGYFNSMPNQKSLNWDVYQKLDNRNIMRLGSKKTPGVRNGPRGIVGCLRLFPQTTHPLTDPTKFIVDSWILPNDETLGSKISDTEKKPDALLFISVHGEFSEKPSDGIRSFDRTFILAPAPEGSAAHSAGWPCVILNEQLTLRQYAGSNAWVENALPTDAQPGPSGPPQAAASTSTAPAQASLPPYLQNQPPEAGLNEQQHNLSLQLAAQTGLTYNFAVQCLQGNSWDPTQAMNNFQALKGANAIPPEGFAMPQV